MKAIEAETLAKKILVYEIEMMELEVVSSVVFGLEEEGVQPTKGNVSKVSKKMTGFIQDMIKDLTKNGDRHEQQSRKT